MHTVNLARNVFGEPRAFTYTVLTVVYFPIECGPKLSHKDPTMSTVLRKQRSFRLNSQWSLKTQESLNTIVTGETAAGMMHILWGSCPIPCLYGYALEMYNLELQRYTECQPLQATGRIQK